MDSKILSFRKLAAIDIFFLGYWFVFAEFACGVVLSIALGLFVLVRSHSFWQIGLGVYLTCIGINYIPMFVYAVSIANKQNAEAELGNELAQKQPAMSKYRRQSLLLLVPLLLPILVLTQKPHPSTVLR